MKIFNTLTNKKEEFKPLREGEVSIYVCGPTVYNYVHIGNTRPMIVFDVLRRTFEYLGYKVTFVSNFTDVDDKIIKAAKAEGITEKELTDKYIAAYEDVRRNLNLLFPTYAPRVTNTMDAIIKFIDNLVKSGYAYEVDGDVYFRVSKIDEYGQLSGIKIEDLVAGASERIDENDKKEESTDFALWKKTDEGIRFDSPWSKGRPGWHTECVVMINDIFEGGKIDIHGGGQDLKFPHHENEIAQSEAANGKEFARYWMHNAFLNIDNRKMSKSLGNGMDPAEIINQYGADLLRLWAASADYHADVRCSHEIFKQLSQNYLKFRNTARYCLGNLDGFDADQLTAPAEMEELDRWAVTRLNALMEKCAKAYNDYEFLVVTHAVNDFCVVDMSNFYLDIIKDRLYCEEKDGAKRRSAQTALFLILDTMTKLMAPILCFTCDEIWLSMPHRSGDDGRNVVFNDMNKPFTDYALDETAMEKWSAVEKLRDDVNAVLEAARAEKKIGKALEAHVALHAGDDAASAALVQVMGLNLAELFIVSDCQVSSAEPDAASTVGQGANFPGLTVEVSEARGDKCERCWMHSPTVGADADHPTLCARCAAVVRKLPQF